MLQIYSFIVDTLKMLPPVLREIARHDVDLARQMRRAASSVALNTAEGYAAAMATSGNGIGLRSGRRRR